MRRFPRWAPLFFSTPFVLLPATPASASFHAMAIQEVFFGPPSDGVTPGLSPDQRAQHVMLRMTGSGQNLVADTYLRVEDANGNLLGPFGTFTANVANGGVICSYPSCPAILIGTTAADNLFTFAFDKQVNGQAGRVALPFAGGRVCFFSDLPEPQVMDCVAWGNFDCTRSGNCSTPNGGRIDDVSGNLCDLDFGTPVALPNGAAGFVLERTSFNCPNNENSTDFAVRFPRPVNNAGSNNNADADADTLIDVLDCDDTTGTRLWPITEVQSVRAAADDQTYAWISQAPVSGVAVMYDVVRGSVSALNGFGDASCFMSEMANASVADGTNPLGPGGRYYLVRAESTAGCGGASTYGPGRAAVNALCP